MPVVGRRSLGMTGPLLWTRPEVHAADSEEDEVFFGAPSERELQRRMQLQRRRTLLVDGTAVAACLAANRVKAFMRMVSARRSFLNTKKAAIVCQQMWRKRRDTNRRAAAITIQALVKGRSARKSYLKLLRTVLFVQARWRHLHNIRKAKKKKSIPPPALSSKVSSIEEKRKALEAIRQARKALMEQMKKEEHQQEEPTTRATRSSTAPAAPPAPTPSPEMDDEQTQRLTEENTVQNSGYKTPLRLVIVKINASPPPVVNFPQPGLIGRDHIYEVAVPRAQGSRGIVWNEDLDEDLLECEPSESDLSRVPPKSTIKKVSAYENDKLVDLARLPPIQVKRITFIKEALPLSAPARVPTPARPVQQPQRPAAAPSATSTPSSSSGARRAPGTPMPDASTSRQPLSISAVSRANITAVSAAVAAAATGVPAKMTSSATMSGTQSAPLRIPTISANRLRRVSGAIVPLRLTEESS